MAQYQCVGGPRDGEVHDLQSRPEHGVRVYLQPPRKLVELEIGEAPKTVKVDFDVYVFVRFEGDGQVVWILAPNSHGMDALRRLLIKARR